MSEDCMTYMPEDTKAQIDLYVSHGVPLGSFLHAVMCNDLMQAMAYADERNRACMHGICSYVYNEVPAMCHGSVERYDAWVAKGGANGHN